MVSRLQFEFHRARERFIAELIPYCSRRKHLAVWLVRIFTSGNRTKAEARYTMEFLAELQKKAFQFSKLDHSVFLEKTLSVFLFFRNKVEEHTLVESMNRLERTIPCRFDVHVFSAFPLPAEMPTDARIKRIVLVDELSEKIKSINDAVAKSESEYILFLDQEVSLLEHSVALLLSELARNQDVDVVAGKVLFHNRTIASAGVQFGRGSRLCAAGARKWFLDSEFSFRKYIDCCTDDFCLVRKEKIRECAFFDTRYFSFAYALADFCLRVRNAKRSIVLQPYAVGVRDTSRQRNFEKPHDRQFLLKRVRETALAPAGHSILVADFMIPEPSWVAAILGPLKLYGLWPHCDMRLLSFP